MIQWCIISILSLIAILYLIRRLVSHFSSSTCDNCSVCVSIDFDKITEQIEKDKNA